MNLLFDYHIGYSSDSKNLTSLPFSVFALTQQGIEHQKINLNNQDSASIYLGKNILIGTVTDGCTSGINLNGKSSSQLGSIVSGYLTVRILRKLIIKKNLPLKEVLPVFEKELTASLNKLMKVLNPWKHEREHLLKNFLLSTILFFVITEEEYLVASCGDGDVFINGFHKSLDSGSGNYFATSLLGFQEKEVLNEEKPLAKFETVSYGNSDDLNNILLSSDGFLDQDIIKHSAFGNFFFNREFAGNKNGFIDKRTVFRNHFLSPIIEMKNGRVWPHDDATFISVQRVEKGN